MASTKNALIAYETASALSDVSSLQSRSLYNMGNCITRMSEAAREDDPHAAAAYCKQATWLYRSALQLDPSFENAAYNLEMTLRAAARIEEQLREQEEQEQQQNELFQYIREKLTEFIERQGALIQTNTMGEPQTVLRKETEELVHVMETSKLHEEHRLARWFDRVGPS